MINNSQHTIDTNNINNNTQQPPNSMGGYMPTLIDKMKEDIIKLKHLCHQLKDQTFRNNSNENELSPNPTQSPSQNQLDINLSQSDKIVAKWIDDRKLLLVKTELVSIQEYL